MKKKNFKLSLNKQKVSVVRSNIINGGGSNDRVCMLEQLEHDRIFSFDGNCPWSEGTDDFNSRVVRCG
ncbi:hypothetical protein GTQ40_10765 [Flavobacteriaceae bacterium R38]|nr:hypothetical protein [Flavobacteriaceae bacterium R38]